MRLFFALEPPTELAIKISDWRDQHLRQIGRPVPAANFHITLAFLGELGEQQLERLCQETDELLQRREFSGASLVLNQLGYWHKPGICWLGPENWPSSLTKLARGLEERGTALGCKRKRSQYQAHLTLSRGCQTPPPAPATVPEFLWDYQRFCLMESHQGRQGVSYQPIAEWTLTTDV
jgi:2'-5' RNA ligase